VRAVGIPIRRAEDCPPDLLEILHRISEYPDRFGDGNLAVTVRPISLFQLSGRAISLG